MKNFILVFTSLFISHFCFSQTPDTLKLNKFFEALDSTGKFMGSVVFSKEGKVLYSKSIGYADIENQIKITNHTKFRIGSISKTFTTALIFKAIEEQKLTLNKTLDNWYPGIENSTKISIEDMLRHRSGIHSFTDDEEYLMWNTQMKQKDELLKIISKAKSEFSPGEKSEYSNSNFLILSFILEEIYQKSYSDLLNEKIVKPFNLQNTYYGGKINIQNNECYSYTFLTAWEKASETDMSIPSGAGAIVSNPIDLNKFAEILFSGKIISNKDLKQMMTIKDHYGQGLFEFPFYERKAYGHTGGIDGFSSVFMFFPDDSSSYSLTSNAANFDINQISIAVLSCFNNLPFEIPIFKTYHINSEELDKYTGIYSSPDLPLKITITKNDAVLIAQATGQPAFTLEAYDKDLFKFDQAGIVMEFKPDENRMILKQGGGVYTFTKE
jgi:D-alanyl-D-alanine carboxypeptidase